VNLPTLPEWYSRPIPAHLMPESRAGRRVTLAVRRAMVAFSKVLARELISHPPESWLSGIEPRTKIVGVLILVITATLLQELWPLLALLALALTFAVIAKLAVKRIVHIWLGIPLFSLAIVAPATLNLVTNGPAVLILCHFAPGSTLGPWALPEALVITQTGLVVAGRIVLRSLACVTLMLVLVTTTEPSSLLRALRNLGMPRAFGMVLTMSHRYLAVLLRAAEELHLAKLSRSIMAGSLRREQRWVATGVGMLFRRTHRLAQEVNLAMLSRGYDGDLQVNTRDGLRTTDWAWLGAVSLLSAAFVAAEYLI